MKITATYARRKGNLEVEITRVNTYLPVKRYEITTTNGSMPFSEFTHGGWSDTDSAKVLGDALSDVKVDGIPASQWLMQEERKKRMQVLRQMIQDGNVMFPAQEKLDEMVMV